MKYIKTSYKEYLEKFILNENFKLNDNFWKWFSDSKMKDENNNPIVFYHGSNVNRKFSKFNDNNPIWFTKFEGYAKAFTSDSGKIFSVYLKITNPLYIGDIDGIANDKKINYLSELTNVSVDILKDILKETNGVNLFKITNSERFKKIVVEMGYDGFEAKEGGGLTTYAVFNSNQIKSTSNNGNWSIVNNNINESFYLGSDKVVGVKFKFRKPLTITNDKTYNTDDTWTIDKAIDDDHYCTNTNTSEEDIFHTDIILSDTVMSEEDMKKFN
jgi:hypothetical protein